ncbi:hypothetical protein NDR87_28970 [Nocardia sp. CDC159]|uniref:Uncharacterized protein n=1 Tax=Nocardia pulmonis TaxID=2951408 RepID=A0A9X2EDK9_9NOCA|nr:MULTISPECIES: hypothetical protein [Nocardia]MCM6777480.1 hypothetical protein [Nocardia pulmonis]MCM6790413.1 hypothetical protein [Nocardia sp. CDC159]
MLIGMAVAGTLAVPGALAGASPADDVGKVQNELLNDADYFERVGKVDKALCSESEALPDDLEGVGLSDAGIKKWWEIYDISPLRFVTSPTDEALKVTFAKGQPWAPPVGLTEAQLGKYYARQLCDNADAREKFVSNLKTYTEKYGTKLDPGIKGEDDMKEVFLDKLRKQEALLTKEGLCECEQS